MIVAYCKVCLPNKVVLGYANRRHEIDRPHQGHPYTKKNGLFPISYQDWNNIFVEGDDAQTKANIIAQFGAKMV